MKLLLRLGKIILPVGLKNLLSVLLSIAESWPGMAVLTAQPLTDTISASKLFI